MNYLSLQIAVIDNGIVNGVIKNVDNIPQVGLDNKEQHHFQLEKEVINHGTLCAGIIKKYAFDANIVSLKIMPEQVRNGALNPLVDALNFCIDEGIKIANVSLGTNNPISIVLLGEIVKKALEAGIVIVASGNRHRLVYPAAYETVIYCDVNKRYIPMDDSLYLEIAPNGQKAIIASGRQKLNLNNGQKFVTPNYSSFSAPIVTSVIWRMMQEHRDYNSKRICDDLYNYVLNKPSVHSNQANI